MRRTLFWIALGTLLFGALLATGAYVSLRALRPRSVAPIVYVPGAHPTTPWRGTAVPEVDDEEPEVTPKLPAVKRSVPVFNVRVLDGCSREDLDTVETRINDAIDTGAPMYNEGDFAGCYGTYESAALSIEHDVGKTCKGPASALKAGRDRAAKLTTLAERAWAMRDAFDGLLNVLDRRGPEL
jgi:hypothetical protein